MIIKFITSQRLFLLIPFFSFLLTDFFCRNTRNSYNSQTSKWLKSSPFFYIFLFLLFPLLCFLFFRSRWDSKKLKELCSASQENVKQSCKARRQQLNLSHKILLSKDISKGKERVKIPVINDVDTEGVPSDFNYVVDFIDRERGPVAEVLRALKKEAAPFYRRKQSCGVKFLKGEWGREGQGMEGGWDPPFLKDFGPGYYVGEESDLKSITPFGVHECLVGSGCGCGEKNQRASFGISLPLEIFKTKYRGWGVRCRVAIPTGTFVMAYYGKIYLETEANLLEDDEYLFALDHFFFS